MAKADKVKLPRVPSPQRRAKWLLMLKIALCLTILPGWPGTPILMLGFMPCSGYEAAHYSSCNRNITLFLILGMTLCCIAFCGLIFLTVVISLRYSKWYTKYPRCNNCANRRKVCETDACGSSNSSIISPRELEECNDSIVPDDWTLAEKESNTIAEVEAHGIQEMAVSEKL